MRRYFFIFLGIILFIITSCGENDIYKKMDEYCLSWCKVRGNSNYITRGEWHGNDEILKLTRCGCYAGNELLFTTIVRFKEYEK